MATGTRRTRRRAVLVVAARCGPVRLAGVTDGTGSVFIAEDEGDRIRRVA